MAKRDTANLVLNVRRDRKQEALQGALLVPWRQLAEGAVGFRGMAHDHFVGAGHY